MAEPEISPYIAHTPVLSLEERRRRIGVKIAHYETVLALETNGPSLMRDKPTVTWVRQRLRRLRAQLAKLES